MKRPLICGLLVVLNLALAGLLASGLSKRSNHESAVTIAEIVTPIENLSRSPQHLPRSQPSQPRPSTANASIPTTPFTAVYSDDPKQFAANLRAIRCPEETVKDIIVAEVKRRFRAQEDELRPKPADHVPWTWSASTSEARLLQRRQQAAALAREKAAMLRDALGYEVPVDLPLYAMSTRAQQFNEWLTTLSGETRNAVRQVHESYWTQAASLQARTKGFWELEDVAELERLKRERQRSIDSLLGEQK